MGGIRCQIVNERIGRITHRTAVLKGRRRTGSEGVCGGGSVEGEVTRRHVEKKRAQAQLGNGAVRLSLSGEIISGSIREDQLSGSLQGGDNFEARGQALLASCFAILTGSHALIVAAPMVFRTFLVFPPPSKPRSGALDERSRLQSRSKEALSQMSYGRSFEIRWWGLSCNDVGVGENWSAVAEEAEGGPLQDNAHQTTSGTLGL